MTLQTLAVPNGNFPFLPNSFTVFDVTSPVNGYRQFYFTLPDTKLVSQSPGVVITEADGLNTNDSKVVSDAIEFAISDGEWNALSLIEAPDIVSCSDGSQTIGTANLSLIASAQMLVCVSDNISDELTDRIVPKFKDPDIVSYSIQDVTLPFKIDSAGFPGKTVDMHGTMAFASTMVQQPDPDEAEQWVGDMFIAIDWGIDPLNDHEYLLLRFTYSGGAATEDKDCLTLDNVIQHFFGKDSVGAYFSPEWNTLVAEVGNPASMYMEGAIPDLLFLYDFSGSNSVAPSSTLEPGMLNANTVLPTDYEPDSNVVCLINQYDAGVKYTLPKRFPHPNPVPNPGGTTPGGNACGPTSLGLMLRAAQVSNVDPRSVFDNTTTKGVSAPDNAHNGFGWDRAWRWLSDGDTYAGEHAFSAPSPLADPDSAHEGPEVATDETNDPAIGVLWSKIDNLLDKKQPVEFRTDLSVGFSPGGGHCIMLLGREHRDQLTKLYPGTSGDCYIVGDPAGHFFSNQHGAHYDLVENLSGQGNGVNYGGWFGLYPKELLQQRISDQDSTNWDYRMETLTIGAPFNVPSVKARAHSPVSMVVIDPLGRQTGVLPDGSVVKQIPSSYYIYPIADEEQDGGEDIDPNGVKTVEIDQSMDGVYQIHLVGTNSGSYIVDWSALDLNGALVPGTTNSGTTTPGAIANYAFTLQLGGTPSVQVLPQANAIALFWPTNAAGYTLQTSAALGAGANWINVTGPFAEVNGLHALTNSLGTGPQFFRLKK